jgi:hypothetical protein
VSALYAVAFAIVGLLVGWGYFFLMRYSLLQLGKEKQRIMVFVAFALLRMVAFGGGLLGAALVSTWSLIAYALGFVIARTVAVSRAKTSLDYSPPCSKNTKNNG